MGRLQYIFEARCFVRLTRDHVVDTCAEEREIIAQRVQSLGGEYDPELLEKVTHFLIAKRPEGEKYGAAKDWGIPIVSLAWLKACETRGCEYAEACRSLKADMNWSGP